MPCRRISSRASDARASGRTVCTSVVMISATRMGCLRFHPSKAVLDEERRKRDTSEDCRFHAHVVRTFRSVRGRPEVLLLTAVGKPDGFKPPKIGPRAAKFPAGAEGRRAGRGDQYQIRRGIRFAHVMHVLVRS